MQIKNIPTFIELGDIGLEKRYGTLCKLYAGMFFDVMFAVGTYSRFLLLFCQSFRNLLHAAFH